MTNAQGQDVQVNGSGMRVGVIDSGIDYTHKMLGGVGDKDVFKNLDGSKPTEHFPNKKVVGGIDLVGKTYNANSSIWEKRIPQPDVNPIDEGGHGTHVAGTIAAADNSYGVVGMAPGNPLHIIKVFNDAGWGYSSDLAHAANKCSQAGAEIISMSLGGGGANTSRAPLLPGLLTTPFNSICSTIRAERL